MSLSMRAAPAALAAAALLLAATPAVSERWVETPFHLTIDVDGIRKGPDGLAHYRERHINLFYNKAFDCAKRLSYFVEEGKPWRSQGRPVVAGSIGAEALNYVCSRAR
jgi:hypothetical protein